MLGIFMHSRSLGDVSRHLWGTKLPTTRAPALLPFFFSSPLCFLLSSRYVLATNAHVAHSSDRTLSSHALAALAEFNAEKDARRERFEELKAAVENSHARGRILSMDAFGEDWNESQFWVRR
jgi:hypothetical protein